MRSSDFTLSKMGSYLRASGLAERADLCLKKSPADAVLKRTGRGGGRGGRLWLRRQWQRWRAAVRVLIFLAGKSSGISWLSSQERKYLSRVFKGEEMLTRQKRGGGKSWHDRWHGGWKGPANSDAARNRLTGAKAPGGHWGQLRPGRWSVASWDVRALPSGARETRARPREGRTDSRLPAKGTLTEKPVAPRHPWALTPRALRLSESQPVFSPQGQVPA